MSHTSPGHPRVLPPVKYEILPHHVPPEAIGAHSGYRIRLRLDGDPAARHVRVHVRGSESEDEIEVGVPRQAWSSDEAAFDAGYAAAQAWIDAEDKRLRDPRR